MSFLVNIILYIAVIVLFNYGNESGYEGPLNLSLFLIWSFILIYAAGFVSVALTGEGIKENKVKREVNRIFILTAAFCLVWHGWVFTAICMLASAFLFSFTNNLNSIKHNKEV